jgi:hypothetical protein
VAKHERDDDRVVQSGSVRAAQALQRPDRGAQQQIGKGRTTGYENSAYRQAARIRAAVARLTQEGEFQHSSQHEEFANRFEQPLIDALGQKTWEREQAAGAAMTLGETITLARSLAQNTATAAALD